VGDDAEIPYVLHHENRPLRGFQAKPLEFIHPISKRFMT
jgi:hypothetical protein